MEFMIWMQWFIPLLSAMLAGSGVWTLFAARSTAKATKEAALAAAAACPRAGRRPCRCGPRRG